MEVSVVDRCKLLREVSAVSFAAWELHLYLDTHPCDEKALEMHKKYSERAMELKKEYEEYFGPLTHEFGSGCIWVKDPWPWEYVECGC
jgi:spore coat protein JB